MDTTYILGLLSELAYLLIVFGVFLFFSIFKGRQFIINVIFGLYLALLLSLEFPFYDAILGSMSDSSSIAAGKLAIFGVFTLLMTWLAGRVMPDEFRERKTETLGKKSHSRTGRHRTCHDLQFQCTSCNRISHPRNTNSITLRAR